MDLRPRKLLDQVRDTIRLQHYSPHTDERDVQWIKRLILFHEKRHPDDLGAPGTGAGSISGEFTLA